MPLSWNEIKSRALAFSKTWEHEYSEDAEAKSFWDGFFDVFGISRRRVATFETAVRKADNKQGFIDLLWKGHILVEHKSRGKDLDKAFQQAKDYFPGLKEHELPKYILVSDFQRFRLYDLENSANYEFDLKDLFDHVHLFGFIAGYEKRIYKDEDQVNIKAAELMGRLHDRLEEIGYTGHALEVYLVRLLFCLFADDTGIFERGIFWQYIDLHTKPDGSDLAAHLSLIFHTLNTLPERRLKNLDENLAAFPYVNGKLFEEQLPPAAFDSKMRDMLLEACGLDWGDISPAIFGSMFQAVMNPKERRNLGAHYTSEKNIQKVIKPLFLDDLYAEFEKAKGNRNRLNELHRKIAALHFLDPACGCGNFLIISYRELRELELRILRELNKTGQGFLDVQQIMLVDVDQFAGIEVDEFAARIAEVAMWLIDHQMNRKVSDEFGQYFVRLPLQKAAKIVHGNALRLDWHTTFAALGGYNIQADRVNVIQTGEPDAAYDTLNIYARQVNVYPSGQAPPNILSGAGENRFDYILGNPPFIGSKMMTTEQRADLLAVVPNLESAGVLDYVSGWYLKAAQYIQNTRTRVAFVSTNSITQGEQVSILWNVMLNYYKVNIHFAHRTFKWSNEAKGVAAVHCVIIAFASFNITQKKLFDYEGISKEPQELAVKNINPYLVDGNDILISRRQAPICDVPNVVRGSIAYDGGYFFITKELLANIEMQEPEILDYIRSYIGSTEYINNNWRKCFWLKDVEPAIIRKSKILSEVVKKVFDFRSHENAGQSVKSKAKMPTLFGDIRQPETDYIVIPRVSSERRNYIPFGFVSKDVILGDGAYGVPNASFYLLGMLTSIMHMAWVKYTCGRLKSDYRYSKDIVYNNYPFPLSPTDAQKQKVEAAAQAVLDARARYPDSSLADLYDPVTMPPDLVKAHQALDKAVDLCYRPQPFAGELSRIEFLFGLYEQYTAGLFGSAPAKGQKKNKG